MAKRRRVRVGNVILISLLIVAIIALLIFVVIAFKQMPKDNNEEKQSEVVEKVDEEKVEDSIKIDLVDYESYQNNIFDFNFVLARIRFKSDNAIEYDLSKMKTNEGIYLNNTKEYITKLQENSYFVSSKNVVKEIKSNENSYIATIFVPYTNDDRLLSIDCGNGDILSINIEENYHDIKELYFEGVKEIESDDYNIFIKEATISYVLYENGVFVDIPSSIKVYTFTLTIEDIKDGITLKEAKYVENGNEYEALSKDYISEIASTSMFAGELKKGESYGLMFEVMSQDNFKITYDGDLMLKFSSSDEWVKVKSKLD